jgi:hypothetical protein
MCSKHVTMMSWEDTPHLDAAAKAELVSSYPPHMRDARTKGIPQLGSGAIYPTPESEITVDPFPVPVYWPKAYGMDVGWNRTAAICCAIDREADIIYLVSEYYQGHAEPSIHAQAIRARAGDWMPGVVDPASRGRSQIDGAQLLVMYRELGLNLAPADNTVEAGLYEVWQRLSTGRLKVFKTLQNWLGEYRIYRRDEKGRVVKEGDHLMDATRYLIMSGIAGAAVDPGYLRKLGHVPQVLSDFDPFGDTP